jgi:SagB-type dehydrogenase family enzyme
MLEWKPLLTVRPNHVGGKGDVQISDALGQVRYKVRKQDLLDAISSREGGSGIVQEFRRLGLLSEGSDIPTPILDGIDHWRSRNWTLALSYYLWSTRDEFLDEGAEYERIRCDALNEMLEESPLPLPEAISSEDEISLGTPTEIPPTISLGEVLANRRTSLKLESNGEMDKSVLHGLLLNGFLVSRPYHVPDIKQHIHNILHGVGFAFDPFLAVFDVKYLEPGIYYYNISEDRLKLIKPGMFRREVCSGLIGHEQALTASLTAFLTVDFRRFQWRYRHERALRNLYFDSGRMAQYFILVATAYGIKTHITPATVDDELSSLLDTHQDERQVFHTITLGY